MTYQWPNEVVEVSKVLERWFDPVHDYRSKPASEWGDKIRVGMTTFIRGGLAGSLDRWTGVAGGPAAFVVVMFHATSKLGCPPHVADQCAELARKCARECVLGSNSLQKLSSSLPSEMRSTVIADFIAPLRQSKCIMDFNAALKATRTLRLEGLEKELKEDFKSLEQTQTMSMSISEPAAQQPAQPLPVFDAMQFGVHSPVSAPSGLTPVDDSPHVPTQQNHTQMEECSPSILQWNQNSGEITAADKSQDTIKTKVDEKLRNKAKSENANTTIEEGESRSKKKKTKHKHPDHGPSPPARYIPGAGSIAQKVMLPCRACGEKLTVNARKRPVCFCDHILCETCVDEAGVCPLCNARTELVGEERVHAVLLKAVGAFVDATSKSVTYPCDNHEDFEVKFICYQHKMALCGDCAWDHRDHENSIKKYSSADVQADLLLANEVLDNHINQCQELRESTTHSVAQGNIFRLLNTLYQMISRISDDKSLAFAPPVENDHGIDSQILTVAEAERIVRMTSGTSSDLKLLYRASRDGDTAQQFHALCDNKGPTLVVVSANGKKFGGFSTTSWISANRWSRGDRRNFIFHLDPDFVIHGVDGSSRGTHNYSSRGPLFGSGYAICISSGCLSNATSSCRLCKDYPTNDAQQQACFNALHTFRVTDYEVFAVSQ